ncbi:TRAP transporter substrate-binding protein DctP [Wenzhouxiangella marina]|uniref:Putative TRAP dicarboxylate transporter n=1 Tax=Wenzhouxiangella marina TaxID=1579979 RepID=A0A0K0XW80_9GAMM|nr:TRAP transporter substrate-binding protein DctP [Wenzhouxiangella marina]AKS41930.1 Putative TRAP dicarboxylate transporter [Wenzhouxiangella marina]MBB6086303.1 TRAP-type C4-dicarboxylate transport system substrate-binding protein [Wenzhouxiangella marina]
MKTQAPLTQAICGLLLVLFLAGAVHAQQLKIATLAPDGSSWMNALNAAADAVEADTEGRVSIRYYPGGVMGDANAIFRRMRLGQLNGGAFTLGDLVGISGAVNLYSLPFVFDSVDEIQALRPTYDPLIIEALEEGGVIIPGIALGGFAYLFGREAFPDPDEMDTSWRVWVQPEDTLSRETLERLGVSPVPLALAEVYTALQTGAINTFASTTSGAIILQWHTRARHMLDLPVLMTGGTIGFDPRSLGRMADADREVLLSRFAEALAELERSNLSENQQAREALLEQGVQIDPATAAQIQTWREGAAETRRNLLETGAIDIPHLEDMQRDLEALRAGD